MPPSLWLLCSRSLSAGPPEQRRFCHPSHAGEGPGRGLRWGMAKPAENCDGTSPGNQKNQHLGTSIAMGTALEKDLRTSRSFVSPAATTRHPCASQDTAAGAPTVLLAPLSSTPPRLLSPATSELRMLQPKEAIPGDGDKCASGGDVMGPAEGLRQTQTATSSSVKLNSSQRRGECYGPLADQVDPTQAGWAEKLKRVSHHHLVWQSLRNDTFIYRKSFMITIRNEGISPGEAVGRVRRGAERLQLRPAGLGTGEGVWRSQKVRGDEMTWLNVPDTAGGGVNSDLDVLLAMVAALRHELDEALGFGSRRISCMVARYPGAGARYARHRDALPTAAVGRRLTAVYYLNRFDRREIDPAVPCQHGGCLRAHLPAAVGSSMPNTRKSKEEFDTTEGTQQASTVRAMTRQLQAVESMREEDLRRRTHAAEESESVDAVLGTMMGTLADGLYVDGTFGRGGHSRSLLARLAPTGRLRAFDVDPRAVEVARCLEEEDPRLAAGPAGAEAAGFQIFHRPFGEMQEALRGEEVDGVLMDLGAEDDLRISDDTPLDLRGWAERQNCLAVAIGAV
eukprot:Skav235819  [mRNA]  locus=scaffold1267:403465:410118:- [translate_table: standard]